TAWFLVEAVVVVNVCLIMTGMMYMLHIFPNTDIVLVFVISVLYGFTIVMFSFMATPFFSKSKVAGSVVGLMMLLFSFFYMLSVFLKGRVSTWVFYVIALLSPAAFTLGIERISQMDMIGSMRFRNVFEDGFSVGSSMLMLLFDIFLYGFLAYYFDAVIPGEFGQSRSPWFIFRCFAPGKAKEAHDKSAKSEISPNADVEDRPAELLGREAIRIQDLRKVFHSWRQEPVVAVDGISLCMHEGQIAALLGHNGAGKSTLLNMLVGTLSPSQGTARIYGLRTEDAEDVAQIRSMLGVCLQEDILFDPLTARQHLTFFARMKGIPKSCIDEEVGWPFCKTLVFGTRLLLVKNILRELDLTDKADVQAVKLSGGQKRKLSVGIALIGDPKIVFLDEPSSGMDPYSRRHLWSQLQKRKEGRVIVLTTHFMDEADILADWKAIICKGKLRCAGTSLFLKNRFGIGYHLTMVIENGSDKAAITQLIQQFVPNINVYRTTSTEIAFILPMDSTYNFANLFSAIESAVSEEAMGIKSYGISMTTLEEVFLKMGEVEKPEDLHLRDIHVRMLLFLRAPMHVVPLVVLPVIMVVLSYSFLSKNEVPVNKLGVLTPEFYPDGKIIEAYRVPSSEDSLIEIYEKAMAKLNMTVRWNNGSPLLENIPPGSYYAQIPDNLGAENKYLNPLVMLVNDSYVHTLPILQSLTFNTLFAVSEKSADALSRRRMQLSSYPWPQRGFVTVFDPKLYTWTMMMSVVIAYMPLLITVEVVEDRQASLFEFLPFSSQNYTLNPLVCACPGLLFSGYWFTVLLSHAILYLLSMMLTVLALVIMGVPFLSDPVAVLAICSMFPAVPVIILDMMGSSRSATALHIALCLLVPFYIPIGGLYYITKTSVIIDTKASNGYPTNRWMYFEWESNVLITYIACLLHLVLHYFLLRIADIAKAGGRVADAFWITRRIIDITPNSDLPEKEDDDVRNERRRVADMDVSLMPKPPVVYVHELRKVYEGGSQCRPRNSVKVAIHNLSLAIDTGDIFGLLGPNGAGKTTTMKVIVGEESPSSGRVAVGGFEITSNMCQAFKMLGYCPQHDALWNNLTLQEHLHLFGALRGIKSHEIGPATSWCLEVNLSGYQE
ncbi:hypothetical protein HPB47_005542, partial [Ixodes persulcatus]